MCGDLQAFVRALDLDDVTLVGWSMGAGVALKYVTDFNAGGRVTKLVMVGAATPRFRPTETEPFGMDDTTAQAALEGLRIAYPETMAAFGDRNFYRTDREATERWFLSLWLKTPSYVTYKCFKTLLDEDLHDRLPKITIPSIIFHGRHEQVCHPGWVEYMAARIAGSRIVWFENSGHALVVEEPERFSAELAAFVG